jgi:hypothetical protein
MRRELACRNECPPLLDFFEDLFPGNHGVAVSSWRNPIPNLAPHHLELIGLIPTAIGFYWTDRKGDSPLSP